MYDQLLMVFLWWCSGLVSKGGCKMVYMVMSVTPAWGKWQEAEDYLRQLKAHYEENYDHMQNEQ